MRTQIRRFRLSHKAWCFTMSWCGVSQRVVASSACFLLCGILLGMCLTHYGFIFEDIRVHLSLTVVEAKDSDARLSPNVVLRTNGSSPQKPVVPNIVHFIWFGENKKMTFVNFISIYSAHKIQKPDSIMFHCNHLPIGPWWQKLWKLVPLKIMHREPPTEIHGQKLLHAYHQGDIAKLEILMEYGGIYLDYDVIMVSTMDPLRRYNCTLGKEKPPKFIAGIIVASPNSLFLRIWYESYKNNYRPFDWDYNCARMTYKLYLEKPELLHVEPRRFTTPDWQDRHLLWKEVIDWSDLYVIHIMQHLTWGDYDPENIKKLDSTFGQVTRFIYYGSPEMR